ncbi:MAG TPA: efflux RND transporter periplasmic adaptor subunit [Terriglobia bacterium]|nr:efflux RND transporter periplasmic adaptor subunit [Terriglobia bacterium]
MGVETAQAGQTDRDALWRQFAAATSPEAFCSAWLALHCRSVSGIGGGVVVLGSPEDNRPFAPVAFWPDKRQNLRHLATAAERALNERKGIVLKREIPDNGSTRSRYDIAYPFQSGGRVFGVVALDLEARPAEALDEELSRLRWSSAWMDVLFNRSASTRSAAPQERLQATVGLLATMAAEERFHGAALSLATALATRFSCDRVSIGFLRRGRVRVEALSHSAEFGKETNLIRAIGVAMDEAVDQQASIVYPELPDSKPVVLRGQAELSRQFGNGSICSIPLKGHQDIVGAITFERGVNEPFPAEMIELFESVAALAGPLLDIHRREDQWLWRKVLDSTRTTLGYVIGPKHVALKLGVVAALVVAVFLFFAQGDYRVTSKTVIEPATRQTIVPAFDGYLREAPVRAGYLVSKGQLLAKLDDRDLRLERAKSEGQLQQVQKQYYEALGSRNAAQVQIYTSQLAQARAQLALLTDQLARTEIVAPIDGVIVAGDLSHALGAPVERGQTLFEIAPLDAYRIILQVDERDVGSIAVAQQGQLVLSGFVDKPLNFTVARMTPVSTAIEGRNFFRVEARLDNAPENLRPGMEGVSKVFVDRRRLVWIWSHEIIDWARLKIWNWLP